MGIVIEQENFETLPMGEYPARIVNVGESVGQFGRQLVFTFEIEGGDHDGRQLKGWSSATFSRKSKLYTWVRAAFGAEIPEEYSLDTDHLIGRKVRLGVIVRLKADTGEEFNKIDAVLPAKRTAANTQPTEDKPTVKWTPPDNEDDIQF